MKIEASKISAIMEYFEALSYETLDDGELHEKYDEMLEECCEVKPANLGISYAIALKEQDPIAYDCGFNDWLDAELKDDLIFEIDDEYLTEDQMNDLRDQMIEHIELMF